MIVQDAPKLLPLATGSSTSVARRKFRFTKKLLDNLPSSSTGQRAYYYDAGARGLALAVSPGGKKNFVLYRKILRRPERITIGPWPDLTIEQARGRAEELNGAIARGENPAAKRRIVRDEMTLGELFKTYLEHHAKPHKKTWAEDEEMFRNHLHALNLRRISHIRKTDIVELHLRVGRNSGEYMANRVLQLLRGVFNKAIEWGWKGENPASRIKAFKEHKRERFLQPDELPAFFRAVAQEPNEAIRDYVLLSLLTGARRSNVQAMRWSEINWAAATWRIPETKSKSGEAVTVTLPRQAIEILERRRQESEGGEWVLPGWGSTGHLVEPKAAWAGILKRAGIENLRLHDLRRTLGSWQAATGASLPVIGKSLGHKSLAATQVYARLNLDPVRASVNKAVEAMFTAAHEPALLGDGNGK
jgi:integrase